MATIHEHDPMLMQPLPSTRVPWLVILFLLASMVLLYLWALRTPAERLLGGPPHRNEYYHYMTGPAKKPAAHRPVMPPAPAVPSAISHP